MILFSLDMLPIGGSTGLPERPLCECGRVGIEVGCGVKWGYIGVSRGLTRGFGAESDGVEMFEK